MIRNSPNAERTLVNKADSVTGAGVTLLLSILVAMLAYGRRSSSENLDSLYHPLISTYITSIYICAW